MLDVEYRHVDVFSQRAFGGNGLCVVLGGSSHGGAGLLGVAREMRQFETSFVTAVDLAGRTASLRIFTEDEELDFAGHPVLGSVAVLHSLLERPGAEERWKIDLAGRLLHVYTSTGSGWTDAVMDQGVAHVDVPLDAEATRACCAALGLALQDLYPHLPLQVVSTGLPYLMVPVGGRGLARAAIQPGGFQALLDGLGAAFVYVLDPERPEGRSWDNRGRVEDVATGSAAGPALAYLIRHGLLQVEQRVQVHQGRFVGRPSVIDVHQSSEDGHIWVGGSVAEVASGRFTARA